MNVSSITQMIPGQAVESAEIESAVRTEDLTSEAEPIEAAENETSSAGQDNKDGFIRLVEFIKQNRRQKSERFPSRKMRASWAYRALDAVDELEIQIGTNLNKAI